MRPQLQRIKDQLETARRRARDLIGPLTDDQWRASPAPGDWSPGECVAHLNLTSRAFLPLLDDALAQGRPAGTRGTRYRMDLKGWLVWVVTALRVAVKTTDPFVPRSVHAKDVTLREFETLQDELVRRVERADGLDLSRLRIVSPFDARLRYNVYAALRVIAEHQRLHLRQAERAVPRTQGG